MNYINGASTNYWITFEWITIFYFGAVQITIHICSVDKKQQKLGHST